MKIVTVAQMAALEQAVPRQGIPSDLLMEKAGRAVAVAAREALASVAGARVVVLVGPGNNGGDGLVTARHLQRWGAEVTAYIVDRRPSPDPKADLARQYGVNLLSSVEDPGLKKLDALLSRSSSVVDAILGTGRSRPLEGPIKEVLASLQGVRLAGDRPLLLALDLPTGLNADTGEVDPACPPADVTVTLGFPKIGLLTFPGAERVGRLQVVDIGLPPGLAEEQAITLELLTDDWVSRRLPPRPLNSHKGTLGHLLVVAGSRNYPGAAYLASQSAVRTGAGLVTLATPHSVYPIAASKLTEVIHLPLPEDGEGRVHPDAAEVIRATISGYDAMVVGCGLGLSPGTTEFLRQLLFSAPALEFPTVIDADGLNNLSQIANWWEKSGSRLVLTPHPGEMGTLTGSSITEVQSDRITAARQWANLWEKVVALKGAYTVIAQPGGAARLSPFANPGLASGGTGDVLTGIIGGFLAQGLSPFDAACLGTYVHGLAGEGLRLERGDTGTIATDLIARLPETIRYTEKEK